MISKRIPKVAGVLQFSDLSLLDNRGLFRKVLKDYEPNIFPMPIKIQEVFVSETIVGGVRGMHLQDNDPENFRLIATIKGKVTDCLIDLRPNSGTFLQHQIIELSAENNISILVPPGVAHGFQALEKSMMLYISGSKWTLEKDQGVNPITFGAAWPLPIKEISSRDLQLPTLEEFVKHLP